MMRVVKYTVAAVVGVTSALTFFFFQTFPVPWVFLVSISSWLLFLVLIQIGFRGFGREWYRLWPLRFTTAAALVCLVTLIEWRQLQLFLVLFVGCVMAAIFHPGFLVIEQQYKRKSYRRFLMMLWVFDAYALTTALFALNLFFPSLPFWLLCFLGGAILSTIAFMIWQLYTPGLVRQRSWWLLIMAILMVEILWVVHILPFGYLASGLAVTWVWYLLQLLARFHFSSHDVLWQKQWRFLLVNALLYSLFLWWFVRWV